MNLQSAVNSLPPEAQLEVFDFVEFLQQKYVKKKHTLNTFEKILNTGRR
jgi:hypothetical protein